MASSGQHFNLRWNNHTNSILQVFMDHLNTEALVDVSLSCEGKFLKAHKMILSACSPYFQELFSLHHHLSHPIIIFNNIGFDELKLVVEFMYKGEIKVVESGLQKVLQTAEILQIKGLSTVRNKYDQAAAAASAAAAAAAAATTSTTTAAGAVTNEQQPSQEHPESDGSKPLSTNATSVDSSTIPNNISDHTNNKIMVDCKTTIDNDDQIMNSNNNATCTNTVSNNFGSSDKNNLTSNQSSLTNSPSSQCISSKFSKTIKKPTDPFKMRNRVKKVSYHRIDKKIFRKNFVKDQLKLCAADQNQSLSRLQIQSCQSDTSASSPSEKTCLDDKLTSKNSILSNDKISTSEDIDMGESQNDDCNNNNDDDNNIADEDCHELGDESSHDDNVNDCKIEPDDDDDDEEDVFNDDIFPTVIKVEPLDIKDIDGDDEETYMTDDYNSTSPKLIIDMPSDDHETGHQSSVKVLKPHTQSDVSGYTSDICDDKEVAVTGDKSSAKPQSYLKRQIESFESWLRSARIPRPPNAFMIFANEWRKKLAYQHPMESNKDISVRLGLMWKNMSVDAKENYYKASRKADEDHKKKYPGYYYSPKEARIRKNMKLRDRIKSSSTVNSSSGSSNDKIISTRKKINSAKSADSRSSSASSSCVDALTLVKVLMTDQKNEQSFLKRALRNQDTCIRKWRKIAPKTNTDEEISADDCEI